MAKIVKLSHQGVTRLGPKRVRKKKRKTPEDFGQLNLFIPREPTARIIKLSSLNAFEEALNFDEQGRVEEAKEAYWKAIRKGESVADAYCNLGILESQTDPVQAINCFTKSLEQSPRHYQSHYNLANIYSEEKNYALARLHYEIAIEIAPEFPNTYYNLGLMLAVVKDYSTAIQVLTKYKSLSNPEEWGNTDELLESLNTSLKNP